MRRVLTGVVGSVSDLYSLLALERQCNQSRWNASTDQIPFTSDHRFFFTLQSRTKAYEVERNRSNAQLTCRRFSRSCRISITWPFLITAFGKRLRNWVAEIFGPREVPSINTFEHHENSDIRWSLDSTFTPWGIGGRWWEGSGWWCTTRPSWRT